MYGRCGVAYDGTQIFDENFVQVGGTVLPFSLKYQYWRETVCPSPWRAFSSARALVAELELVVTALIALLFIPTGIVKARSALHKKDATVSAVIKSADGMMVRPGPHRPTMYPPPPPVHRIPSTFNPPSSRANAHVSPAWCRSTFSS